MKLSLTTFPWGKLETLPQLEEVFASIKEIGFDGVGIESKLIPKELKLHPEKLSEMLGHLALANGGASSTAKQSELEWAGSSGTPLLWVSVKKKSFRDGLRTLREFVTASTSRGVQAALHNEIGTAVETETELTESLRSIDGLKLCFDTAHAAAANVHTLQFLDKYHERIALIHLKDLRAKLPKSKISFTRDFVNVGKGIIDLKEIVAKLKEVGYEGQLMVEIEALKGQDPTLAAKEAFEYTVRQLG